jgi:hypothetical protein
MARKIKKPEPIKLSDASYKAWKDKLVKFFEVKGLDTEDAEEKVILVLEQAQKGWPHAPKEINTRIKMKSGYQWKSHDNLKPNAESLPNVINTNIDRDQTLSELYQWEASISTEEKKWWDRRKSQFEEEFEFNNSSDQPLIFQMLLEELTQMRIASLILRNPKGADKYNKLMTDSLKRLQDTQTKLGITREQRADLLEKAEGDVASLSLNLDDKIKKAKLKVEQWAKEEAKNKFIKNREGVINPLPPVEKIEALLGMNPDGTLGAKLDTHELSEVMEEAVKIHDETLEDVENNDDNNVEKPAGSINQVRTD